MPRAIEEDLELSKQGLVVILPEVQGTPAQTLPGFLLNVFPKLQARVCSGGGFPLPHFRGIPHTTVIGVDGTLRFDGSAGETKKIDSAIGAELEKVKKGWGPTPEVRRVRALLYGKLEFAEAKKALAAASSGIDEATSKELTAEIDQALATRLGSLSFLLAAGRIGEAKELMAKLEAGCHGLDPATAALTQAKSFLASPEGEKEAAADKKVTDALTRLRNKQLPGVLAVQTFEGLAKTQAGTKSAERAAAIARALVEGAKSKR